MAVKSSKGHKGVVKLCADVRKYIERLEQGNPDKISLAASLKFDALEAMVLGRELTQDVFNMPDFPSWGTHVYLSLNSKQPVVTSVPPGLDEELGCWYVDRGGRIFAPKVATLEGTWWHGEGQPVCFHRATTAKSPRKGKKK